MSASKGARVLACITLLLPLAREPARADIVHLKNGGTIAADSWEARGDVRIIRQGSGRITVPRSDVESIEAGAAAAPGGQAPRDPSGAEARPSSSPGAPRGDPAPMSDDDIQRAIEVLRRRINRSEEHTSELQSLRHLVCRLLLEKKNDSQLQLPE